MKKLIVLAFIGVVLAAISFASPAWAQPKARMGTMPGRMQGPAAAMGAQLSPEQQQTLQKIVNAHQAAFTRLHQRLWAKRTQLQAALTEDRIDEAKVKSLAGEINRLNTDLFNEQVAMQVELARAGLAYYTLRGRGMMGQGMMGHGMMGPSRAWSCPMMDGDDAPDIGAAGGE